MVYCNLDYMSFCILFGILKIHKASKTEFAYTSEQE